MTYDKNFIKWILNWCLLLINIWWSFYVLILHIFLMVFFSFGFNVLISICNIKIWIISQFTKQSAIIFLSFWWIFVEMNKFCWKPATRCICTLCWLRTHQFNQLMKPNHFMYNITFNCFDCRQTRRTIFMCFTRHHYNFFSPPTTIISENGLNKV